MMIYEKLFFVTDVLTASPHASINGLIPLVAWRLSLLSLSIQTSSSSLSMQWLSSKNLQLSFLSAATSMITVVRKAIQILEVITSHQFLLIRIGSPQNGYLCVFLPNVASRWYAVLETSSQAPRCASWKADKLTS